MIFFFDFQSLSQEYIVEHSPRRTVRHIDLRFDERVVFDCPFRVGNDLRACRSSCKSSFLKLRFFEKRQHLLWFFFFFLLRRNSELELWEVSVSSYHSAWPRLRSVVRSASNLELLGG